MKTKLTLRLEDELIDRAKSHAKKTWKVGITDCSGLFFVIGLETGKRNF